MRRILNFRTVFPAVWRAVHTYAEAATRCNKVTNAKESPASAYLEQSVAELELLHEAELKGRQVGGRCSF